MLLFFKKKIIIVAKEYLLMFPNFNEYTRKKDVNRQAFNSTNNHSQYFLGVIFQKKILDTKNMYNKSICSKP